MKSLQHILNEIKPIDAEAILQARHIHDGLVKPIGSLGRLEELGEQLAGIYRRDHWSKPEKKIYVMAADHGVFDEGVAVTPQSVTELQARNTVLGRTGVCALAMTTNTKVELIDTGMACDDIEGLRSIKVCRSSRNIALEPAMTRDAAETVLLRSVELVKHDVACGINVFGVGELGIANTTPAAAIISVITSNEPEDVVGLGANLPRAKRAHKVSVVERAISINGPIRSDAIDTLAKVGGFDLAGMTGIIIGCAYVGVPVVLDGFLSYASALIACQLNPLIRDYLIPSHYSAEQGSEIALRYLDLKPFFDLNMRLGEGSGAALAMGLIDAAYSMRTQMGTLKDHGLQLSSPQ
ncbi:nicotinate-nucleotide--dimethylbenzimidazole phosphoribosyltransferase [Vibrio viridaestus]|uniref:Nicotinate-nucleotide--dimethylbenzimidazole phosphoribosyltransferase n=1 Tax=Vibrio viridaestus TaxID=2487322 RepID=A0A3N9TJJ8_9VIBR|nr:nicotinate-nucleotide--dimethylbenzimidazole phosphoribosyltransferase [Vibrio viridaestus]RQW64548.1 nicotinate-nucleotide--dimethylbenzimidazole phosphoribosyltransferase [Vibrio viridaestus]